MRRILALLGCCMFVTAPIHGGEVLNPDGIPMSVLGGLKIIRTRNQTVYSIGGVFFSQKVMVTQATPVVTRFTCPITLPGPKALPLSECVPAVIQVEIPDNNGLLYIEDELISTTGTVRQLQSPSLPPGKSYVLHLRAAFKVGDKLLIEDKLVSIRAGQDTAIFFDGSRAISVPLPQIQRTEGFRKS